MGTTWEPLTAPMSTARRSGAMAEVLVDGTARLYVVGGYSGTRGVLRTVEAYNLTSPGWETRAPMPTPRTGHAVVAHGGLVYTIGGYNREEGFLASVDVYDPATDAWKPRTDPLVPPDLVVARAGHGAVVHNGVIYVIGGFGGDHGYLDTCEWYRTDPPAGARKWTILAKSLSTARSGLAAVVHDMKIYAVGGVDASGPVAAVEAYSADTWAGEAQMPTARCRPGIASVDGALYVFGGFTKQEGTGVYLDTTDRFRNGAWQAGVAMSAGRYGPAGGLGSDTRIFSLGGFDGTTDLGVAEAYAPLPVVTQISPSTLYEGQRLTVILSGDNLDAITGVSFGTGITATIASQDARKIAATVTIGRVGAPVTRGVTLTGPSGAVPGTIAVQVKPAPHVIDMWPGDVEMSPHPAGEEFLFRATVRTAEGVGVDHLCVRWRLDTNASFGGCVETAGGGHAEREILRPGESEDGKSWTVQAAVDVDRNSAIDATDPVGTMEITWKALRK